MRYACLHNKSFVLNFLKIYKALMKWTPWRFLAGGDGVGGGDGVWRGGGHSPRIMGWGSWGEGYLPNSFGGELILFMKTHFYRGALTSHFMEEHSSPSSIFPILVLYSDPVIRAAMGSFSLQRVTLVQFWTWETGQIGDFPGIQDGMASM